MSGERRRLEKHLRRQLADARTPVAVVAAVVPHALRVLDGGAGRNPARVGMYFMEQCGDRPMTAEEEVLYLDAVTLGQLPAGARIRIRREYATPEVGKVVEGTVEEVLREPDDSGWLVTLAGALTNGRRRGPVDVVLEDGRFLWERVR